MGRHENGTGPQFATMKAGYNQIVHQVSPAGRKALKETELLNETSANHGPWVHSHMVACVTASIELATLTRADVSFIPQHQILERAQTSLSWPVRIKDLGSDQTVRKDLKPDALFGLSYHTKSGEKFRFFVLEADRGTEPVSSRNWNRKSFERHLAQYEVYIEGQAYKEHLQLSAPLLVLNVEPDANRAAFMMKHCEGRLGSCTYQMFQSFEAFAPPWKPPEPNADLLEAGWARAGMAEFWIDGV